MNNKGKIKHVKGKMLHHDQATGIEYPQVFIDIDPNYLLHCVSTMTDVERGLLEFTKKDSRLPESNLKEYTKLFKLSTQE